MPIFNTQFHYGELIPEIQRDWYKIRDLPHKTAQNKQKNYETIVDPHFHLLQGRGGGGGKMNLLNLPKNVPSLLCNYRQDKCLKKKVRKVRFTDNDIIHRDAKD